MTQKTQQLLQKGWQVGDKVTFEWAGGTGRGEIIHREGMSVLVRVTNPPPSSTLKTGHLIPLSIPIR